MLPPVGAPQSACPFIAASARPTGFRQSGYSPARSKVSHHRQTAVSCTFHQDAIKCLSPQVMPLPPMILSARNPPAELLKVPVPLFDAADGPLFCQPHHSVRPQSVCPFIARAASAWGSDFGRSVTPPARLEVAPHLRGQGAYFFGEFIILSAHDPVEPPRILLSSVLLISINYRNLEYFPLRTRSIPV